MLPFHLRILSGPFSRDVPTIVLRAVPCCPVFATIPTHRLLSFRCSREPRRHVQYAAVVKH